MKSYHVDNQTLQSSFLEFLNKLEQCFVGIEFIIDEVKPGICRATFKFVEPLNEPR